ncbi:MAG: hypothetical protein AB7O97_18115 [Planctomycetota bacterium]
MKLRLALTGLATALLAAPLAFCQSSGAIVAGTIDSISIDDPSDVFSGGRIVVAGQLVILPRNLLIDLPANRLTLQQLFADAPPRYQGESGLATDEVHTQVGGIATILANRTPAGNVIAGDVFLEKGAEVVTGRVTFIDHTQGYFRIDGNPGDPTTGLMIRINDPSGRHTIQSGLGTDGGPNGSADPRFGLDPDNYTITFTTGYPAGLPSTVPVGQRAGFAAGDDPAAASDANGVGDPFCPATNRGGITAADSRRFAPIQLGDFVQGEGNLEDIGGVRFVSVHTLKVFQAISTRNTPDQPDYMTFDEVEWDVPGFQNERVRALFIGFTTLANSQVDLYALYVDPATGENNEVVIGSTVNNPDTVNQGVGANAGGIFKIRYDVDFVEGAAGNLDPRRAPGQVLTNAGFGSRFPNGAGNFEDNFAVLAPITREMIGRSRHKLILGPGVITRDVNGNEATNGEYLTPVGLGHPEFVEIDLARLTTPFLFEGIPWNLDRRLGPGGFNGPEAGPQRLDPFPVSGLDPTGQTTAAPANIQQRVLGFFPFQAGQLLNPFPPTPAAIPIEPTPGPAATSLPPLAVLSATVTRTATGSGTVNVLVQAETGLTVQAQIGTTSILLDEVQVGRYFGQLPFPAGTPITSVGISTLSATAFAADATLAPISDLVTVQRALFAPSAKGGSGALEIRATSSDLFGSPTLEAFADDGTPLGTLSNGVLRAQLMFPPATVSVVSNAGGVGVMPVSAGRSR